MFFKMLGVCSSLVYSSFSLEIERHTYITYNVTNEPLFVRWEQGNATVVNYANILTFKHHGASYFSFLMKNSSSINLFSAEYC